MREIAAEQFADYVTMDMEARGFHVVTAMHPVDVDAVVTIFAAEHMAWSGPYTVVAVMASGLELMQNAERMAEFARARVATAVKAYRETENDPSTRAQD